MSAMTLEPCPFCGGKAIPGFGMIGEFKFFNVRCRCGAGVNEFIEEQAAHEAWNRRSHLTAHAQMVEKVREVVAWTRQNDPNWSQLDKLAAAIGDAHG